MWKTRVGYAGGESEQPTYRSMGDHTECFQVDFDPDEVPYEDLLELFWTSHDPSRPAWKTQYASLILAHDEQQLAAARASAQRIEQIVGRKMATRIEMLDRFWLAEDYHQKYYLRNEPMLLSEISSMLGDDDDVLRESTAAARVNGYLYGAAGCVRLEKELPSFGLSDRAAGRLIAGCHG